MDKQAKIEALRKLRNPNDGAIHQIISNLEKIKGEKGDKGDKGDQGIQGIQGFSIKGDKGDRGEKGDKGDKPRDGVDGISPKIETIVKEVLTKIPIPKDGISPKIEDIVSKIKQEPLHLKDIKGTKELIEFLKLGGFRGGGGSGSSTGGLFTPQGITTATVGGIVAGTDLGTTPFTFQELAIRELYPAVPPTISLSSSPIQGLREFGDNIASVDLSALTAANTNPITLVQFYRNASLIYTVPTPNPTGGTETYTDGTSITSLTTYNAKVSDGFTGVITSNTLTFSFVYPYLHGIGAAAMAFASMYASLTHQIATQGNKLESFAPNSQVMYFGYPATYPDLTSILDQNNFETFTNWTKRTGNITGLDGSSQSYKVYEFNNLTGDGSTIQYTFKY